MISIGNLLFNKVRILEISTILLKHAPVIIHGAALGLVFLVHSLLPSEVVCYVTHIYKY